MASTSEWRRAAQRAIDMALEEYEPGWFDTASEYTVRNILKKAYPFGERAMHPYKVWLSCVNEELRRRGYAPKQRTIAEPHFRLIHGVLPEGGGRRRDWWLDLVCDYCEMAKATTRGCLMCASRQDAMDALVNSEEWHTWIVQVRADPQVALFFADRLDEWGHEEIGRLFRTTEPPRSDP